MKKIGIAALLFGLLSVQAFAVEKVVPASAFPKDKKNFDLVGQEYVVKKDNPYWIKKFGVTSNAISMKPFLRRPERYGCSTVSSECVRKEIYADTVVSVLAIVEPVKREKGKYTCSSDIIFCFYKLKFEDGDIAYMQVSAFQQGLFPINATAFNFPSLLQIIPKVPDPSWEKDKEYFDTYFSKRGVLEGFTQEDVLRSNWGKPNSKTRSSVAGTSIEVWMYDSGVLSFADGVVTQITTVE